MKIDHDKYPIIIGAKYKNLLTNQIGVLDSCELFREKNDALIEIDMQDCGMFYRLNYSTFSLYWVLVN